MSVDHALAAAAHWTPGSSPTHVAALVRQTETASHLFQGGFEGSTTIGHAFEGSWLGLGVAEHLNGELVCVDGEVWRVPADGRPVLADLTATTPFAISESRAASNAVTTIAVPAGTNLATLLELVEHGTDQTVTLRLEGSFCDVVLRSERAQLPPYRALDVVLASDEVRFPHAKWNGVMVGYRFPSARGGVLLPGLHLHGLSGDRASGGHVKEATTVDVSMTVAPAEIEVTLSSERLAELLGSAAQRNSDASDAAARLGITE